jgi:hypothetical protein
MTKKSKSAKKGWHTRRVKVKYKEICDLLEADPSIVEILEKHKKLFAEVKKSSDDILDMRFRYDSLVAKVSQAGNVMENLPIESVTDCIDFEKYGRPLKGRFSDIIEAGEIRRNAIKMQDETRVLTEEAQMAKIDLAEAACKALIKLLDK